MRVARLLIASFLFACVAAYADDNARVLYQRVQSMRNEAGKLMQAGGEENNRKALAIMQEAMALLASPEVRERAEGSPSLYGRNHDARIELAQAYAALGDVDKAMDTFEAMQRYAWVPRMPEILARMPEFDKVRASPRWAAFVARADIAQRLWQPPAIAVPFKEKLTVEERIAGLSLYWAEAREHFAWFENVPDLDWSAVYMEFLPKVMAAETTRDYYRVMMQLAPRLHDGHTNIYPPKELQDEFYARPPLRTRKIGERVVVTEVMSPSLDTRVHMGDEILAVDGIPALQYGRERVRPFASASTPQDLDVRVFTYQFLGGDKVRPVKLRLRGADGREHEESISRGDYNDLRSTPNFAFRMLPGDIAYLSLDQFESDAGVKAFVAALPQIMDAKGLVLDVRRNGGGSTNFGLDVLTYLVDGPVPTSVGAMRQDFGARRENVVAWRPDWRDGPYQRKRERIFKGPVAVLAGPQTFSAAEDFLVSFDLLKRGPIVGEPTGGSTGQPMIVSLPGGGTGRICAKRDSYPDGRNFVGRGVQPTLLVQASVEDLRRGEDVVLARAVEALRAAK